MATKRSYRNGISVIIALVWTAWWIPPVEAAAEPKLAGSLREQAREAETKGQWKKACELYDQLLAQDRSLGDIRERYQTCLRHSNLIDRHRDPTFQQQILNRDINFALKVYKEILTKLHANYFDKDRSDFTKLFQSGLEQLIFALDNEVFRNDHLPANMKIADVNQFQAQLREQWGQQTVADPREASVQVFEVALAARKILNLKPVVTVMEFACGACAGLDEYTLYLTPGQISDALSTLEGEIIGIGIAITIRDQRVLITEVLMGSPAGNGGLKPRDWIIRLDGKPVDNLPEEIINERLRGPSGSKVELEIFSMMDMKARTVELVREVLRFPSIVQAQILPQHEGLGYCRILTFQKTTVQELDDTLVELKMQGLKVLILDLRGNRGGLLTAAVQVAERFLAKGKPIVATQSGVADQNRRFKANYADALTVPLVVLVDGETASAAEVLAAALKDNVRATLVGQTTYGKWSIQRVLQLEASGSGVRITLAKLLSPLNEPYSRNGIKPDLIIDQGDQQLEAAIQQAISLAFMRQ